MQDPLLKCRRPQFDSWVKKIPWRRDRLPTPVFLGFPCGSAGKESACAVGDLGLIPGLGRSPVEGKVTHSSILAWRILWTIVHGVTKSQTQLSYFHFFILSIHRQAGFLKKWNKVEKIIISMITRKLNLIGINDFNFLPNQQVQLLYLQLFTLALYHSFISSISFLMDASMHWFTCYAAVVCLWEATVYKEVMSSYGLCY